MSTPTKPRRWFHPRFGLRTVFVLVTLFSLWLAWQVHIVQERKAMLRLLKESGDSWVSWQFAQERIEERLVELGQKSSLDDNRRKDPRIPWIRTLLGDQQIQWIQLHRGTTDDESIEIRKVFPEALITIAD